MPQLFPELHAKNDPVDVKSIMWLLPNVTLLPDAHDGVLELAGPACADCLERIVENVGRYHA